MSAHQSIVDRVMGQVDQAKQGVSFAGAYSGPEALAKRNAMLTDRAALATTSLKKPASLPLDYMFIQAAEGRQYYIEREARRLEAEKALAV